MTQTVRVALVGVGGYGGHYLRALLEPPAEQKISFVAAVDPVAGGSAPERVHALKARGVPLFANLAALFAHETADLVVIASPHHFHCPQTCQALAHGANVLCEKPVAATIQDARRMMAAERQAGKFVAVGYQWSYTDAVQGLKRDILAGRLGRPIRLKTLCLWPRTQAYYARNTWAGRLHTDDGAWVLDSPANNATAHYLHNMLYLLGPSRETSARPVEVTAELYRANAIENFDTAALRCRTEDGAEILFYTTHAVAAQIGPVACYQFEKATVHFDPHGAGASFVARFADGRTESYGSPNGQDLRKLWDCADAVRTGAPVACGVAASSAQLLCVNGAHESMPRIGDLPKRLVHTEERPGSRQIAVQGLADAFLQCYDQAILPSEHGDLSWAKRGETIGLTTYRAFPSAHITHCP